MENNIVLAYFLIGFMVLFLEIGFARKESRFTGLILPVAFLIIAIYNYFPVLINGLEFTEETRILTTIGLEGFIISGIIYLIIRMGKKGGK